MSRKFFVQFLLLVSLMLSFGAVRAEPSANFTVTSALDIADFSPGDGSCMVILSVTPLITACTLRAAIQEANLNGNLSPDSISFSAGMAGATITLSNSLGGLVLSGNSISINGTPGTGNPQTISGAGFTTVPDPLLTIGGSNNIVQNLIFRDAPTNAIYIRASASNTADNNSLGYIKVVGSGSDAVQIAGIDGQFATNNQIAYSTFGVLDLTAGSCTASERNYTGVDLLAGSENTLIYFNDFWCGNGSGIYINNSDGHVLSLNRIGIGALSSQLFGNLDNGVDIANAFNITISNNLIGKNTGSGIYIDNSSSIHIRSNNIGVESDGVTDAGNQGEGIYVKNSNNLVIGGDDALYMNVISGNSGFGVRFYNVNFSSVLGNIIGLNITATASLPNVNGGMSMNTANVLQIGGTSNSSSMQYISGNGGGGVIWDYVNNSTITARNYIGGNGGLNAGLGNYGAGVSIYGSVDNIIQPADVRNNNGAAIDVIHVSSTGNLVVPLKFSGNYGLAVDLEGNGFTPNDVDGTDADPGANTLLNYPLMTSRSSTVVNGTACAFCRILIYRLQSGNVILTRSVGDYVDSTYADAAGYWSYANPSLPAVLAFSAVDATYNTSELSPAIAYNSFLPIIIR